jgi:hypothetical protein
MTRRFQYNLNGALRFPEALPTRRDAISSSTGDSHINNPLRAKPITKFTDLVNLTPVKERNAFGSRFFCFCFEASSTTPLTIFALRNCPYWDGALTETVLVEQPQCRGTRVGRHAAVTHTLIHWPGLIQLWV